MSENTKPGRFFVTYEIIDSDGEVVDSGYSIPGWKTGLTDEPDGANLSLSEAIDLTGAGLHPTSPGNDCLRYTTHPEPHDYAAGTEVVMTLHVPESARPSSRKRLREIATGQRPASDLDLGMSP